MRKQCKLKHWNLVNTIQHAIEGVAITDDALLNQLRARELSAIESFRAGSATLQDWCDITSLLNICETMAGSGIGPEALEACAKAEAELIAAAKRYETTGRMGTTGQGLQAFREIYEYHDLQRQSISRSEYDKMINKTIQRVKSKAPGVRDMAQV